MRFSLLEHHRYAMAREQLFAGLESLLFIGSEDRMLYRLLQYKLAKKYHLLRHAANGTISIYTVIDICS